MAVDPSHFCILLGGDVVATDTLTASVAGMRTIAADSGLRHAQPLGLVPELWCGDFDSSGPELHERWKNVERLAFDRAKDATDGEIAVEAALARGARRLLLVGAFGGSRSDHALFHLTLALRLAEAGHAVCLSSGREAGVPILPGAVRRFELPAGTVFSILALSELRGLTLEGAVWPLVRRDVSFGSSLTLSNETAGPLEVTLDSGRAIMITQLSDSPDV